MIFFIVFVVGVVLVASLLAGFAALPVALIVVSVGVGIYLVIRALQGRTSIEK